MAVSTSLTDAATAPQRSDPDGFRATADTFVDWLANTFVTEMQAIITEFNATFDNIWSATSTTSLAVGTGDKTFTIAESEIAFAVGSTVRISDNAAPATNYMEGTITAYTASTGSMTVSVSTSAGSGTIADWTISYIPPTGFFLAKTSNLSDLDDADTALTNLGGTATGTAVFKAASAAAAGMAVGVGLVLLSTTTADNDATIELTGLGDTYSEYEIHMQYVRPATDDVQLLLRTSSDGITYDAGASDYGWNLCASSLTAVDSTYDLDDANIDLTPFVTSLNVGNAAEDSGVSGVIQLQIGGATTRARVLSSLSYLRPNGNHAQCSCIGQRSATGVIGAVRFLFSSGNFYSGTIQLFGVRKS